MEDTSISLLEEMRRGREESSTAFMEFTGNKELFLTHVFVFYEGEDRKYYNDRIRRYIGDDFYCIVARNKENVLEAMRIIKGNNDYNNVKTMFFVDRDMDFICPEYSVQDLFVTPCYSIENLYVCEKALRKILKDEFGINEYSDDYNLTIDRFHSMYDDFNHKISVFNALVLLRNEKRLKDDKVSIQSISTNSLIKIDILSGLSFGGKYNDIISDLKEKLNVTDVDISEAHERLLKNGKPSTVYRGKNQLDFFVEFISQLVKNKDNSFVFKNCYKRINIDPHTNRLGTLSPYAETPNELITFVQRHKIVKNELCLC